MTDERRDRRSETARRHDDSELIDETGDTPSQQGQSGGNIARDVGTDPNAQHSQRGVTERAADHEDLADDGSARKGDR